MGKRGPKKGSKHKTTLSKEAAEEIVRQELLVLIRPHLPALFAAAIENAKGLRHTFLRDKAGRFVMMTDPKQIEIALNSGDEGKAYWTHTKDPSIQALSELLNRLVGKAAEPEQSHKVTGSLVIQWQPKPSK